MLHLDGINSADFIQVPSEFQFMGKEQIHVFVLFQHKLLNAM